ncbi:hypothetical protein V866_002826 [Kwoniella sp. B9012]|uniref:Uncharacterized protein n=1 Tax=Kwoniella europaea PYCC6329 TaxID=1423913 RepID=A0AAX4KEH2_9TREE
MSQPSPKTTTDQAYWNLPDTIAPIQVLPDRFTKPADAQVENLKGKESDPSRMGVFVCLLDDKPHLHPSLISLHKHRLNIHHIPLPPDPSNDLPIPQSSSTLRPSEPPQTDEDISMTATSPTPAEATLTTQRKPEADAQVEWFMWKFSEEEENRRKSYLPLA